MRAIAGLFAAVLLFALLSALIQSGARRDEAVVVENEHWRAMERVADKFSGEHHLIYQPDGNLLPKVLPFTSDAVEKCISDGFATADRCLERQGWRFVEKKEGTTP
jgi:hypothetical protein